MKIRIIIAALVFYLATISSTIAQEPDSSNTEKNDWTPYVFGLRASIGFQKTIFSEIGLSYHRAGGDITSPGAQCFYNSVEWIPEFFPQKKRNIYSFKLGYEHTRHLLVYALEGKYTTDLQDRNELFILPKVGFGIWGMVNIMYGYHLSLSKEKQFNEIGKHQFAIVCNVDKLLIYGLK